ncbi:MAG: hypothetical protein QXN15_10540 [Candidatus Jordarchaeales archaeon]
MLNVRAVSLSRSGVRGEAWRIILEAVNEFPDRLRGHMKVSALL